MTGDCPCCGADNEPRAGSGSATDRWRVEDSVLTTELPAALRSALGRFLGVSSVNTLGGWVAAIRHHTEGDSISMEDLCLSETETEHWGAVDGERYHFACFYDAVILSGMVDDPVDIRTMSPNGRVIEARAVGTDALRVTPEGAVFSFGIDETVEPPGEDGPSLERGYAAICPYVKAFPNRAAYDRWAGTAPAATVAMPLAGATELATAIVR